MGIRKDEPCSLPVDRRHIDAFNERNRRFQETNPLISLNDSIDFVQQIHWNCSTIPLVLFLQSAIFAPPICCFHRSFLAVLPESIALCPRFKRRDAGIDAPGKGFKECRNVEDTEEESAEAVDEKGCAEDEKAEQDAVEKQRQGGKKRGGDVLPEHVFQQIVLM